MAQTLLDYIQTFFLVIVALVLTGVAVAVAIGIVRGIVNYFKGGDK